MESQQLAGQVALITGAAGAIGRAIARTFAEHGATLCLVDIDGGRQTRIVDDLQSNFGPGTAIGFVGDVRDPATAQESVEETVRRFGRLDILVNNAVVVGVHKIDELEDEELDLIIDINLKGYFYFCREFVRHAKKTQRAGIILMISSKNGLVGAAEKSVYSAVKGAEITLARSLARELGSYGIRVNTICPDAVIEGSRIWDRGGTYSMTTAERHGISEAEIPEYYRKRCALKVNIEPEDVANAALFLCSGHSAKVTGAVLTVDGGVGFVR